MAPRDFVRKILQLDVVAQLPQALAALDGDDDDGDIPVGAVAPPASPAEDVADVLAGAWGPQVWLALQVFDADDVDVLAGAWDPPAMPAQEDDGVVDALADDLFHMHIADAGAQPIPVLRDKHDIKTATVISVLAENYKGAARFTVSDVVGTMWQELGIDMPSEATVRRAIQELINDGLIREDGRRDRAGRGRREVLYHYA